MTKRIEDMRGKLYSIIDELTAKVNEFVQNPGKDFVRTRKLPFSMMLKLFMSIGAGSLGNELLEASGFKAETATVSAFVQQRRKILPKAVYELFRRFTASVSLNEKHRGYRVLAVDGSHLSIAPDVTDAPNFIQARTCGKGYSMLHLNALYDVMNKVYLDAEIQNAREQNEFSALVDMTERTIGGFGINADSKTILLADRGFGSYNVFAKLERMGLKYVVRARDITSRCAILSAAELPDADEFDVAVTKILSRKWTKNCESHPKIYRHIRKNVVFDLLPPDSEDEYVMTFRAIRFITPGGDYDCVITNLPESEFSVTDIKELYRLRWGIETSFRQLKHTIGLSGFHAKNRDSIKQEIYARMTMFTFAQQIVSYVMPETRALQKKKHNHIVNFSVATCVCRRVILDTVVMSAKAIITILTRCTLPVRPGRANPRTVKPQSYVPFNYRPA
jgi:hypothetical protein